MKEICSDFNYKTEVDLTINILKERKEYFENIKNQKLANHTLKLLSMFERLKQFIFQ